MRFGLFYLGCLRLLSPITLYQNHVLGEWYISKVNARYLITLLILLLSYAGKAQDQHIIDSLMMVIEKADHDTTICDAYLRWGEQIYPVNPDTAIILWQRSHDIAEKTLAAEQQASDLKRKYLFCIADALNNIGIVHRQQGEIQKALNYYQRCLKIRENIGDKAGIGAILSNIGIIYDNQGDIQKALDYYFRSLQIEEEVGHKTGIATSLSNIGFVYHNQGDIPNALEYTHKSLKMFEEASNSPDPSTAKAGKKGIAGCLNNIATLYNEQGDIPKGLEYHHKSLKIRKEMGNKTGIATSLNNIAGVHYRQGDFPIALEYFHQSMKLYNEMDFKTGIAASLNNIGFIHKKQGDFTKALEYYHESLKIREATGNKAGIATSLNSIGNIELAQGALTQALNFGTRALQIAREIGSPDHLSTNANLLCRVAKRQGDYQEALEMYELDIQMRDSIKNEETQKATIRQQTKYEFEKVQLVKEQEEKEALRLLAEETSRRDNLQYSVILLGLLVLGSLVLGLGKLSLSARVAEGLIFFSFLILFEFLLVLADPYIEEWSGGAPGIKLLFNAGIAALIFPAHSFFESILKRRLVKG